MSTPPLADYKASETEDALMAGPASDLAVSVRGMTKRYGDTLAVDDVSFEVRGGSTFAFVGTNGAGKSTTIACLTTLLNADAGQIAILGRDIKRDAQAIRAEIGVVFQESILDPLLSVRENLRSRGRFYPTSTRALEARIDELSALIGLRDIMTRRYGRLSGGQRRRVDMARALLASPAILFLDEPTAGLDPAGRALVWSTIAQLRESRGLTVFLTTHYMEETEEADQVCVIDHGRIVAEGTPAQLRASHSQSVLSVTTRDRPALAALAEEAGFAIEGDAPVRMAGLDPVNALRILELHKGRVVDFEYRHGTMDDVFLSLTRHNQETVAAQ
jgi:multidrug/hemolysin transport system ATP-binding protein